MCIRDRSNRDPTYFPESTGCSKDYDDIDGGQSWTPIHTAVCIAHAKVHRYPELTEQTVWEVFEAKSTARRRPCDGALVNRRFAQ